MTTLVYTIDDSKKLERIWDFAQYHNLAMYKTRITASNIAWVIELDSAHKTTTRFLLEFANSVTSVTGTYYV